MAHRSRVHRKHQKTQQQIFSGTEHEALILDISNIMRFTQLEYAEVTYFVKPMNLVYFDMILHVGPHDANSIQLRLWHLCVTHSALRFSVILS